MYFIMMGQIVSRTLSLSMERMDGTIGLQAGLQWSTFLIIHTPAVASP